MFQQGDLLFVPVNEIPEGLDAQAHRVLAEGEATGHTHEAVAEDAVLYGDERGRLYLETPSGTEVTHQEHRVVALPPGRYEVRRVREYDHFRNEPRPARD